MLDALKRKVFWVIARTCFTAYHHFPVFGPLRASLGIIRRDGLILIMNRSDGRGLSFPGGLARRGEAEEQTLRREVHEETGLQVLSAEFLMKYFSDNDIPCYNSVFEAAASGEVIDSWEGTFHWLPLEEIEARVVPSQRPIVERLRSCD